MIVSTAVCFEGRRQPSFPSQNPARKALFEEEPPTRMRGSIDAETILKIILILILVWLAIEIIDMVFGLLGALLWPVTNIIVLVIAALIVLWLLDRI
jgi:uncharacterized membrane protein